jgi:hypothetical protein
VVSTPAVSSERPTAVARLGGSVIAQSGGQVKPLPHVAGEHGASAWRDEPGGDRASGFPQPQVAGVVGVHRVPPERLLNGDRVERAVEQPDAAAWAQPETRGEPRLDHGDPAGARDHGRQRLEAVDGDLDAELDAEQRQLPVGFQNSATGPDQGF